MLIGIHARCRRIHAGDQGAHCRPLDPAFSNVMGCKHVAIDGKTLLRFGAANQGARLASSGKCLGENHLILGQVAVEGKSNEITAIPELLEVLTTKGAVITIDAMECQKEIAATIRKRHCHYALAVKQNQPHLYQECEQLQSW